MADLSIIIVNWKSATCLDTCLRTIRENSEGLNYEIIVVDNASYDGSEAVAGRFGEAVHFVQSTENLGFARANNLGATYSHGVVLLFLNPDTEIQGNAMNLLYDQFRKLPDPGVVGCRLLNSNGSLQTSCVQSLPTILNQVLDAEVLRSWFPRSALWGTAAFYDDKEASEVEAVSGACMMIRREVFDLVGGFSSEYFMYGEDLDLCFKARRAGYRNYHVRNAIVLHHGGGSSRQARSDLSITMMRESVRLFLRKSHGVFYSDCYRATLGIAAVLRMAVLILLFPAWAIFRGTREWSGSFRKWTAILRWGLGLAAKPKRGELKSCAESAAN